MDRYPPERSWVYDRHYPHRGGLKLTFVNGVDEFIKKAKMQLNVERDGGIRCPCNKCMCVPVLSEGDVRFHLYKYGFQPNYWYWTDHGEKAPRIDSTNVPISSRHVDNEDHFELMQHMVEDAIGSDYDFRSMGNKGDKDVDNEYNVNEDVGNENEVGEERGINEDNVDEYEVDREHVNKEDNHEEPPNKEAQEFYDLLTSANQPLYEGASESKLSVCLKLMACKTNWNVPQKCIDFFANMLLEVCPSKDSLPKNFYQVKKLVSMLGLKSQKIDCCVNGCMLYYKDTIADRECRFCHEPRYAPRKPGMGNYNDVPVKRMHYFPITPRLKRLYASREMV
ncbi:unnamed protein product [Lathyrus sativus]|nr:unnamed protein product [Lathyrus sativus]